jgi:hypothetical protein
MFHETVSWLGVLGAVLIALGVVTVNADTAAGPATKPSGSSSAPGGTSGATSSPQQPQQQPEKKERGVGAEGELLPMHRDRHGRLKAKLSFKQQLLPFQLGQGSDPASDVRAGFSSRVEQGRLSTNPEQGLLLPARDKGQLGPLQPLPAERQV